ncbi:tol-pal system protein YbgF [Candidatus Pelagibacter sp.]|nr:tol-pal system protein YbgF [Candidatus Pelagibacter sp.]
MLKKFIIKTFVIIFFVNISVNNVFSDNHNILQILETLQQDIKTLERAVYSDSFEKKSSNNNEEIQLSNNSSEEALTRHLLKLSEIENQFRDLTNKFEEINFKLDKLSNRLTKLQSDNQLRFEQVEKTIGNVVSTGAASLNNNILDDKKLLPGSSEPQDLGSVSYKDMTTSETSQQTNSIDSTSTVILENVESIEKLLPEDVPEKQYEFATSFLKVGDYNTAERALKEFVETNPNHELAGNAQYWFAETFRIRQLYVDAASAYLEGYQKYPKSEKAPDNLLKLGVSLVQIGEKEQGCMMITSLKKEYPEASQSILQKAKYEEKKFECKKDNT